MIKPIAEGYRGRQAFADGLRMRRRTRWARRPRDLVTRDDNRFRKQRRTTLYRRTANAAHGAVMLDDGRMTVRKTNVHHRPCSFTCRKEQRSVRCSNKRRHTAKDRRATAASGYYWSNARRVRSLTKARKMLAAPATAVAFARFFRQPTHHCEQTFGVGERGPGHSLAHPPSSMPRPRAALPFETVPLIRLHAICDPLRLSVGSLPVVRCTE